MDFFWVGSIWDGILIIEVAEVIKRSHNIRKQLNSVCLVVKQFPSVGEIFVDVEALH